MTGTIVVTGCATGLGLSAVKDLLARPDATQYNYIFSVRSSNSSNTKALDTAIEKFNNAQKRTDSQSRAETLAVDFADKTSTRAFATTINDRVSSNNLGPIRAVILNAGVHVRGCGIVPNNDQDGLEIHFMVNYLSNFMLVLLLLRSIDRDAGRIVYTSSWTHDSEFWINKQMNPDAIHWKDDECNRVAFAKEMSPAKDDVSKGGSRRYGVSKFWLVMEMLHLQQKLSSDPSLSSIPIIGVDPGGVLSTGITRTFSFYERALLSTMDWLTRLVLQRIWPNGIWRTSERSAHDLVRAAMDIEGEGEGEGGGVVEGNDLRGLYLNGSEKGKIAEEARDTDKAEKLFRASLRFSGLGQGDTILRLDGE